MYAITRARASTRATSLMRVKVARTTSVYDTYCLEHWNGESETKNKNIKNLIVDLFFLTFVNFPLS